MSGAYSQSSVLQGAISQALLPTAHIVHLIGSTQLHNTAAAVLGGYPTVLPFPVAFMPPKSVPGEGFIHY